MGAMHLIGPHHPVHPGVNHFVAEGAEGGFLGQGLQQRSRQHNVADGLALAVMPEAVQPGTAAHAAVTPAHVHQSLAIGTGQRSLEMLAVQAMKQRQQRNKGHAQG